MNKFCVFAKEKVNISISFSISKAVNKTFIPSMILSLFSSVMVICYTMYELLGDNTSLEIFRSIVLFFYELKQVFLLCYYGELLITRVCSLHNLNINISVDCLS